MIMSRRAHRRARLRWGVVALVSAVLALPLVASPAGASTLGGQIDRAEIMSRAQYWVDHQPGPYNQHQVSPGPGSDFSYRRDCSGYVSMAWHLKKNEATSTLPSISREIPRADLQAGDILNAAGQHVLLFDHWTDNKGNFAYYTFPNTPVQKRTANINNAKLDGHANANYKARRYNNVINGGGGSTPIPQSNGYAAVFQANTGYLYKWGSASGPANLQQGMKAGTSPAITALSAGRSQMAFQANTGELITIGDGAWVNTRQGMMAGTSPAIAASSKGGFRIVFQANTGYLYQWDSVSGPANLQQGMKAGTSPSITALANGGYQVAFQANTGELITIGDGAWVNTRQGMMAGTSPAIAASFKGGFRVVFQANTGYLYQWDSVSGPANLQQGMKAGTSPAISGLSNGGYQMAFQANTGELITIGDGAWVNTRQGMMTGTSPAISASPKGGFRVVFQANTGYLYQWDSASGPANLQQGMIAGTSPAIAGLS